MAVRSGKIRSSTKTFAKNRRRPKPSAAIHRPPRGPPQNPVWFSTIFTPLRDFHFFEETQILSKILKDFGKNLRNLRKPPKRHSNFALECQNSARQTCILAKLAKLANFEKLAKLALQVCTLSATVCSSAVTRGGRSSERCSEGPDVLVYTVYSVINMYKIRACDLRPNG